MTVTDVEDNPLTDDDAEPVETVSALSIAARLDEDADEDDDKAEDHLRNNPA